MPQIITPAFEDLLSEFAFLRSSQFEGVEGVLHIDSGKPGPKLGITVSTHGNEPSGIAALWYLRNEFKLAEKILQGSVFFVVNNLKAAKHYFAACAANDDGVKTASRFCDHNMNRLPENTMELKGDLRYEILRAQELRPIWEKFEVAFDIHSTTLASNPMIIARGELQKDLIKGFPIGIIITNIEDIQLGKPAMKFYGEESNIRALLIEAGSHEDASSFECSISCTLALLRNLQLIAGKNDSIPRNYQVYQIEGSLLFPHPSFELEKVFKMFEPIQEGQTLARGKGTRMVADFDGHALMGPPTLKPNSITEEVFFISLPVKETEI